MAFTGNKNMCGRSEISFFSLASLARLETWNWLVNQFKSKKVSDFLRKFSLLPLEWKWIIFHVISSVFVSSLHAASQLEMGFRWYVNLLSDCMCSLSLLYRASQQWREESKNVQLLPLPVAVSSHVLASVSRSFISILMSFKILLHL